MSTFVASCRAALTFALASAGVVLLSSASLAQSSQSPEALKKYCDSARGHFVGETNSPTYSCVEVDNDKFTSCTSGKCTVSSLRTLKNPCDFVKESCDKSRGNFTGDRSSCYCMRPDTDKFTNCSSQGCTVSPLRAHKSPCDLMKEVCDKERGNFGEEKSSNSCYCMQPDKDKFTSCSQAGCKVSPFRDTPSKLNPPPKTDTKDRATKDLEDKLAKISNETDCKKSGGEFAKDPLGKRKCVPKNK